MPKWLKLLMMVVLKYAPIWEVLEFILGKIKNFTDETENKIDDKLIEALLFLLKAVKNDEVFQDFNDWLDKTKA